MKIKIINGAFWYKNLVGHIIENVELHNDLSWVLNGEKWSILKRDAEVVEENLNVGAVMRAICKECKNSSLNNGGIICEKECYRDTDDHLFEPVEDVKKSCDNCNRIINCCEDKKYCNENGFVYWEQIEFKGLEIKQATGTTENAKHYQVADIQPIEIMQKYLTPEEFIGSMKMQVIKYILRIGHKGSDREDAGKCNQYSQWLCQAMDGEIIVPGGK